MVSGKKLHAVGAKNRSLFDIFPNRNVTLENQSKTTEKGKSTKQRISLRKPILSFCYTYVIPKEKNRRGF